MSKGLKVNCEFKHNFKNSKEDLSNGVNNIPLSFLVRKYHDHTLFSE